MNVFGITHTDGKREGERELSPSSSIEGVTKTAEREKEGGRSTDAVKLTLLLFVDPLL